MGSLMRTRVLRVALALAAVGSLATAAVAVAQPGHGRGYSPYHRHVRYVRATGWVTASPSATTLTLRDFQARAQSFTLTTSTRFLYSNGAAAKASNATPNTIVNVTATAPTTSGANPVAQTVVIQLAQVNGMVKSDTGGTVTVIDTQGFTRAVDTTSSTTCSQAGTRVTCGTIAAGSVILARGTVNSDGTTPDASRIWITAPGS